MEQNELEIQLWNYIDGTCSIADGERIRILLATDEQVKRQYEELMSFQTLLNATETEEPSLRFAKNVMEAVAKTTVAPAASKYVNPFVLRGIATFFIVSIVALIAYAFANVHTTSASAIKLPEMNLGALHAEKVFSSTFIYIVLGVNVIAGLVLADLFLRRRSHRDA